MIRNETYRPTGTGALFGDKAKQHHAAAAQAPNCLYIGTSKAGSTWIFDVLARHPDIFMAPEKGLYYFDAHFDFGSQWYLDHFRAAGDAKIRGEVSHSYLRSEVASRRIASFNPAMMLLVCLREPVERAFSEYLHRVKNSGFEGTFEQAIEQLPGLVDRGRYATQLEPYLLRFGRSQLHIACFDDLRADPRRFAAQMFDFLGVAEMPLDAALARKMMPASRPRSHTVVSLVKRTSRALKKWGCRPLMGRMKRSRALRRALYKPYTAKDKPTAHPETRRRLMRELRAEVRKCDAMLGTDLQRRWGYE